MRGGYVWMCIIAVTPAAVLIACGSSKPETAHNDDAGDASDERALEAMVDSSVEPAWGCVLPIRYGSEECERCLSARCCDVILACEAHPVCNPLSRCILACKLDYDAGGCRKGCEGQFPAGVPVVRKIDLCGVAEEPEGCRDVCTTRSL